MPDNTQYNKNSNEIVLISKILQQVSVRVKCDTATIHCDKCSGRYKPDPHTSYKLSIQLFFIYNQYNDCSIDLSNHTIVVTTI